MINKIIINILVNLQEEDALMSTGRRIRLFRCARGWTLEELALRINNAAGVRKKIITKQALSKYEAGKMSPSPKILSALGKVFGVKESSFPEETAIIVEIVAYRRKPAMTQREEESIRSQVQLRMETGLRLQFAFAGTSVCAQYPIASLADAEAAAEQLRKDWELGTAPIANMTDFLEDHCIHVLVVPFDSGTFEGLSSWVCQGKGQGKEGERLAAAVAVRTGITVCRHRLTLAHELGHLLLHCTPPFEDEENACYRFAGAVLAPAGTLKRDFGARQRTVTLDELLLLKQRYLVSMQCLLRRLLELELISPSHYQEWRARIKKAGWEALEPGDEIRNETGTLASLRVRRGLNEGIISKAESSIYLGRPAKLQKSSLNPPLPSAEEDDEFS
ncbi:MAG: XRE family transcriptional regulator [Synergistaceae bacterium]|nr:XRE family transcriptional regulator [Synergistaceae bacterium]